MSALPCAPILHAPRTSLTVVLFPPGRFLTDAIPHEIWIDLFLECGFSPSTFSRESFAKTLELVQRCCFDIRWRRYEGEHVAAAGGRRFPVVDSHFRRVLRQFRPPP